MPTKNGKLRKNELGLLELLAKQEGEFANVGWKTMERLRDLGLVRYTRVDESFLSKDARYRVRITDDGRKAIATGFVPKLVEQSSQ